MGRLVESSFQNYTVNLRKNYPESARKLDSVRLSKAHHDAVVHYMGFFADDRAGRIGLTVSHAVRDAPPDATEDELKKRIARALLPHMGELFSLRSDIFSSKGAPLRGLIEKDDVSLDPFRIRRMRSMGKAFDNL